MDSRRQVARVGRLPAAGRADPRETRASQGSDFRASSSFNRGDGGVDCKDCGCVLSETAPVGRLWTLLDVARSGWTQLVEPRACPNCAFVGRGHHNPVGVSLAISASFLQLQQRWGGFSTSSRTFCPKACPANHCPSCLALQTAFKRTASSALSQVCR